MQCGNQRTSIVTAADEQPSVECVRQPNNDISLLCYQEVHLSGLGLFKCCDK